MSEPSIRETVTLDRILVSYEDVVNGATAMHRRTQGIRLADQDAIAIRHMVEGWGRTSRVELRCPATWWQHAKLALRSRWPRIFGRLAVRFDVAIAENGAIVAGLQPVMADKLVIPYQLPVFRRSFTDDPTEIDEP